MDQLEQNQVFMREDMTTMRAQMGQLMEAMQDLAIGQEEARHANIRADTSNPAVILPMNPLGVLVLLL